MSTGSTLKQEPIVTPLPPVDLKGRFRQLSRTKEYLQKHLPTVEANFCGFRIRSRAPLSRWYQDYTPVSYIPDQNAYTKYAAINYACAVLNIVGEPFGWVFILPNWFRFQEDHPLARFNPSTTEAEEVLKLLAIESEKRDNHWRDIEMAEGAKHRSTIYTIEARYPQAYILGIRVRKAIKGENR